MLAQLRPASVVLLLLTLLTGVIYPLAVSGLGQLFFPAEANGSVLVREDLIVGSRLIGQAFSSDQYFWGRPSATAPTAYNAVASAGSNLGPTNPKFLDNVRQRAAEWRASHPDQQGPIPVDLLMASGSGLDPHISPAAADYQVQRVSKARGLPVQTVRALVKANTHGRTWALLGEPRVNVLELNLDLDRQTPR